MLPKKLLHLLGALVLILWACQPGCQTQWTCDNLWPVEQDKKWGYIDKNGRLVIPFKFDGAGGFSEGLAAVEINERTGYIDKTGKLVIPPRFYRGYPFSEGLAVVVIHRSGQIEPPPRYHYGYIDKSGQVVIQPPQDPETLEWFNMAHKALAFSEGRACMVHGKMGYIDKAGQQIIPPRYKDVRPFSEGLAAVMKFEDKYGEDKYGYIDRSGKKVIPFGLMFAGPFSEGLAAAHINYDDHDYVDKTGMLAIDGKNLVLTRRFSEGLAAVMGKNYKYGYIDRSGKFVIQPQFDRVGDFSEELAAVMPVYDAPWPGNLAYINRRGEIVIKSMSASPDNPVKVEFDLDGYRFYGGIARVSLGKKEDPDAMGYINNEGKFIWPKTSKSKK